MRVISDWGCHPYHRSGKKMWKRGAKKRTKKRKKVTRCCNGTSSIHAEAPATSPDSCGTGAAVYGDS